MLRWISVPAPWPWAQGSLFRREKTHSYRKKVENTENTTSVNWRKGLWDRRRRLNSEVIMLSFCPRDLWKEALPATLWPLPQCPSHTVPTTLQLCGWSWNNWPRCCGNETTLVDIVTGSLSVSLFSAALSVWWYGLTQAQGRVSKAIVGW